MTRQRIRYVCQNCGSVQAKWMGRCPDCGEWNTLVETVVEVSPKEPSRPILLSANEPQPLTAVNTEHDARIRLSMTELDRVLGGGLVPGSVNLIGGDPGIGKSTLLLQVAADVAEAGGRVLYISGEESLRQIKMRAERLGITSGNILLMSEVHLEPILAHIEQVQPQLAIVDSIQSVYTERVESAAGSVTQVRECAADLLRVAKAHNIPMFLVGHVTKAGAIAGPRVLEHVVDAVLYLEGDRFHTYRLLRSVKNRFGSTNEVGVFEMTESGLREVSNPSEVFLAERLPNAAGSAIAVTMEGTRPIVVEIQALSSPTSFGLPRRTANGVDLNRLLLLAAVLSKRVGVKLHDQDIFVNVVGGLRISEPAADLSVAVAIASSYYNRPVPADLVTIGEVGLSGELRGVSHLQRRLSEAARLGFTRCILPQSVLHKGFTPPNGLEVIGARTLRQALHAALGKEEGRA